jgi:hypothetical protein
MSAVRAKTESEAVPANGQQGEPRAAEGGPAEGTTAKATGTDRLLAELLEALRAAAAGHADVRLSTRRSGMGKDVARAFNDFMELSTRYNKELVRVSRAVGRDGRTTERIDMGPVQGMWVTRVDSVNDLIDDLIRPTNEVARVGLLR